MNSCNPEYSVGESRYSLSLDESDRISLTDNSDSLFDDSEDGVVGIICSIFDARELNYHGLMSQ